MRNSIFHHAETTRPVPSDAWAQFISDGGYEAIIFDCDGTLVESGEAHFKAFQTAIRAQGHELDRAWYDERTGLDRHSTLATFAKTIHSAFDVPRAIGESMTAYISNTSTARPIRETIDLAKSLSSTLKMAVVTNSERQVAAASLGAIGLDTHFDHVVTISDGLPPKPEPDLFIAAATALNTPLAKTLVFEDSDEGVQAAIRAGLDVIQLV